MVEEVKVKKKETRETELEAVDKTQNELFMRIWNISISRFADGPPNSFCCFSALG
jgi:hypothetical protein